MSRPPRKPKYCRHKASGNSFVRINGKCHYLGKYDSPESRERYEELIARWSQDQRVDAVTLTVDELVLRYFAHAEAYYRKNGQPTSELSCIKTALRFTVRNAGTSRVRDFRPLKLKAVREAMINAGHCRISINKHIGRIRRMFRLGTENELVPSDVYSALTAVQGLRRGRRDAVESEPVQPVPDAHIEAIRPYVTRPVWALVRLQLYTAARPGEILLMRACDLDMRGKVWTYTPASHKSDHHDRGRVILMGPQGQDIIKEFLIPETHRFLFSPRDVRPVTPGCSHQPGEHYRRDSYRNAIQRACEKAGIPKWHPHQLWHNAATTIRREFGLEASQVVLGHARADVTQVYADRDEAMARDVIAKIG